MNRRFGSLVIAAATLGITCQSSSPSTIQRAKIDPPKPAATSSAQAAITPPANTKPHRAPVENYSRAFLELRNMTQEAACALPANTPVVPANKGAKPFTALEADCDPKAEDAFCDTVDIAPKGANACFVSNDHIRNAEKKANIAATTAAKPTDPWDGKKKPQYFDRIDNHLHLDDHEESLLRQNGFVVLDRLAYSNYAHAFHDVFQEELPLYVGVDPILHAVFRATDAALGAAEQKRLAPALDKMLDKLRKRLAVSKGVYDDVTLKDLDLYIGIATRLGKQWPQEDKPLSIMGQDAAVNTLHDSIWNQEGLVSVELFGRSRMIDVSQYTPRGHYANSGPTFDFGAYFQAMTWLTRFEWNLVSRGSRSSHPDAVPDPRETPREARDAIALADLFRQSGALADLAAFEEVYSAFGGKREDIGMPELLKLMDQHQIRPNDPEAPDKLKIAIGNHYKRTARTHFMPQGVQDLPVISSIIGPRISADVAPLAQLVHDALPNRFELGAADVGYLLGHDRAKKYLQNDLKTFPQLGQTLDTARVDLAKRTNQSGDIQSSFLGALLTLAQNPAQNSTGIVPSFMKRDAYADLRLSSALVGYGQLRHTFVLLSGQGYDAYGCAIPETYVEPLAPFYAALTTHVQRLRQVAGGGFDGLLRVLGTLSTITKTELARGAPTKDQSTWLGMVAEYTPQGGYVDSGEPPKWTGWYFDMFEDREIGATKETDFIADYFTLTNIGKVAYLGTDGPRLGVFIVDTGGGPRAMVGPVAHGYEVKSPIADRLDDAAARTLQNKESPFRASFAAKPWTEPALGLGIKLFNCAVDGKLEVRVLLASNKKAGPVSVTLLDHHADPLASPISLSIDDEVVVFPFRFPEVPFSDKKEKSPRDTEYFVPRKIKYLVEAISVRIEDLKHSGLGSGPYDYFTSPSVFFGKGNDENLPARTTGATAEMIIGGTWNPPKADGWGN